MDRYELLLRWMETRYASGSFSLQPASADASFRRYFRASFGDGQPSIIAMDAPPPREDCRPFVRIAQMLLDAGVNAPRVIAQDLERGFLLLSDLGNTTYLSALDANNADALFGDAIDALLRWQLASRPGMLPPYDEALLRRELELFPEWYIARHTGVAPNEAQNESLRQIFTAIVSNNLAQPPVYVHRDYMPRNLMLCEPNPGVLDFQDAVYGPISYDLASLFKDAFLSWPGERVLEWNRRYWERAGRAGLPVRADFGDFQRDIDWMGLQRHLKVLGIFARLKYRDGKPDYIADTPRFLRYVRETALRYRELKPLLTLLDQVESRAARMGAKQ